MGKIKGRGSDLKSIVYYQPGALGAPRVATLCEPEIRPPPKELLLAPLLTWGRGETPYMVCTPYNRAF